MLATMKEILMIFTTMTIPCLLFEYQMDFSKSYPAEEVNTL
jgi:hypothetical protein